MKSQSGFTLIELMIAVVILTVLAAVALPSYRENVAQSRRAEARAQLLEAAQYMERYASEGNGSYAVAAKPPVLPSTVVPKGASGTSVRYNISLVNNATTFTVKATPVNVMAGDKCAIFTLDNLGVRNLEGSPTLPKDKCWK